jgi:hypothetical protein
MNKRKSTKTILLSILAITLSLTLVGCNKKDNTTVKEEITIESPKTKETSTPVVKVEPTKETQNNTTEEVVAVDNTVEETPIIEENDKLDLAALGYEIKDNLLYLNGGLLSTNEIVNYTIEKDEARFNNSDSSSIVINKMGDIEAVFPVGLTLNVNSKLTSFDLSYGDATFNLPTIVNISETDGWYRLTLSDNIYLRFNDITMEAHVDGLFVSFNKTTNKLSTKFNDAVLTTSYLKTYYVNAPSIQLSYEDGSVLTHTIGGDTTFIQKNGMETINNDEPTINVEDDSTPLEAELTATTQEEETSDILITEESEEVSITPEPIVAEDLEIEAIADTKMEDVDVTIQNFDAESDSNDMFDDMGAYEAPVDTPNHIGIVGNYSFLTGDFNSTNQSSTLGARMDIVFEKEISTNLSIALELGIGANKFDDGFFKYIEPMFTIDYNFKQLNSDSLIPYATFGVGSVIPLLEENHQNSLFKAKAGVGLKYNINNKWMLKTGINYTFNNTSGNILNGLEIPAGIIYKF